ncbi:hypothetical protein T310_8694, partial [Rasamsonia emersonii CBS 393.64]
GAPSRPDSRAFAARSRLSCCLGRGGPDEVLDQQAGDNVGGRERRRSCAGRAPSSLLPYEVATRARLPVQEPIIGVLSISTTNGGRAGRLL